MTDEQEFLAWKAERDEQNRTMGDYWLTPEGRAYIREIYTDYLDGNAVLPLLNALERAEDRVRILEDRSSLSAEKACALLKAQLAATNHNDLDGLRGGPSVKTRTTKTPTPLTDAAVRALIEKECGPVQRTSDMVYAIEVARAVERAHGIVETTTDQITHISLYPPSNAPGSRYQQWLAILRIASDTTSWDITENDDTAQEALAKGLATFTWATSKNTDLSDAIQRTQSTRVHGPIREDVL